MRAAAPAVAKVTPELIMQLRRPAELALSHDGNRLAYIVSPSYREKGQAFESRLWIDGRGEVGDIAGSVEDIQWSPDSRSLLVLAADLGSDRAGAQTATKIKE